MRLACQDPASPNISLNSLAKQRNNWRTYEKVLVLSCDYPVCRLLAGECSLRPDWDDHGISYGSIRRLSRGCESYGGKSRYNVFTRYYFGWKWSLPLRCSAGRRLYGHDRSFRL